MSGYSDQEKECQILSILKDVGATQGVQDKFVNEKVYAATVVLLTDSQLRELGLQSMGEIATVRAACQAHIKDAGVHSEVASVMGFKRFDPKNASVGSPVMFNPRNLIERRPRRLSKLRLCEKIHKVPLKQTKYPRITTFRKHLFVFEFMGSNSPRCFSRADRKILLNGIMEPISTGADENDVREEILAVIKEVEVSGFDLSQCEANDFEFIQVSAKTASVPNVRDGFSWTGDAVKSLAGQGGIYVRLTKDFSVVIEESSSDDDLIEVSLSSQPYKYQGSIMQGSSSHQSTLPSTLDSVAGTSESAVACTSESAVACTPESAVACTSMPVRALEDTVQELVEEFSTSLKEEHIIQIYKLSGNDFEKSKKCLDHGSLTLTSILTLLNERFAELPRQKLFIDFDDTWSDMVSYYKGKTVNYENQLRINLDKHHTIDTGGVRRQVYTLAYEAFANNQYIKLFEGPDHHLRPICSAEARSSGLLKVLGSMVSHSICQDGIGFPYLSPTCFWYIVGKEEKAIQFASIEDLPADSSWVISQVQNVTSLGDLNAIATAEVTIQVFQRCGITQLLKMSNRDVIAQEILCYDAVFKVSKLLDQFCEGLQNLGILDAIRTFPDSFLHLLTYTASASKEDVLRAVYVNEDEQDEVKFSFLKKFIEKASEQVLEKFLFFSTGSICPQPHSIEVRFEDDESEGGAITARTCSKSIIIPHCVFSSYEVFDFAMNSVVGGTSFNTI